MAVRLIDDLGRIIRDDILLNNTRQVPNVPRGANDILTKGRINNWAMDVLRGKPLQAQATIQGDPLDVLYPRGGNMNLRNYFGKVGTSGFPGNMVRDFIPSDMDKLGQMYRQNWGQTIDRAKNILNKTKSPAGKVLGYGQLAMLPIEMAQNEAMARQMERENLINPYLHTQEAIDNRRARNANLTRWAGYGGIINSPFGPGAAAKGAGLMSGAALLGEGIADKFSKRKSVVDTVGTYKPLNLTDEQLARVLMTQEQRDANPREAQQPQVQEQPQMQTSNVPFDMVEIPESEFSNPQDFPYQIPYAPSWMANDGTNPIIQEAPTGYAQSPELRDYADIPQGGENPILTGEVNNGTPGLDFNGLRNYMTPGEIAYQDYLTQSPLSDPQKIADLLLEADRNRYRYEIMANMMAPKNIQELPSGAFVLRSNYQQPSAPMSQAEAIIKAQQTAGNIIKLQSELEDKALQRQGAEQVARQMGLPPALLTNPDLAKQALSNYGRLQTVGLQEGNRYDIAKLNNQTKREIARDLNILGHNKLYSNAQIAQAKLNMQEKIARMTGDARLASALVNLATNSVDSSEQVRAQLMLNAILNNAGYETNYTIENDKAKDFGYDNLNANDTWDEI